MFIITCKGDRRHDKGVNSSLFQFSFLIIKGLEDCDKISYNNDEFPFRLRLSFKANRRGLLIFLQNNQNKSQKNSNRALMELFSPKIACLEEWTTAVTVFAITN